MNNFGLVSSEIIARGSDYTRYPCPFCDWENQINSSECAHCRNPLMEHEAFLFSKWNLFNEALEMATAGENIASLEKLAVFLSSYPKDRDANRLRLFLLARVSDSRFNDEADTFIKLTNDRWVAELQDDADSVSLKDLKRKPMFRGESNTSGFATPTEAILSSEKRNLRKLTDVINSLFAIHARNEDRSLRRRGRVFDEFNQFYKLQFVPYLNRSHIEIVDYTGQNFDGLPEEVQGVIGHIEFADKRHKKNGVVIRSLQPEIRYRGVLVQRAHLEVNRKTTKGNASK